MSVNDSGFPVISLFKLESAPGIVFVVDHDAQDRLTVTNAADAVIEYIVTSDHGTQVFPRDRVVYRDTEGLWSELKREGAVFKGYAPLSLHEHERLVGAFTSINRECPFLGCPS